ncbi:MAG: helix-turn-helix transcriptional regulator [Opitutaceae bacterium]|jgi:DNA-binding CsgD family transcriptional regulator
MQPPTESASGPGNLPQKTSEPLLETDVRALVRLLGEVGALDGGHAAKKRMLMNGLCTLINARSWVWGIACDWQDSAYSSWSALLHGGFSDDGFGAYFQASAHSGSDQVINPFFAEVRRAGVHLTRRLDQVDPANRFDSLESVHLWRAAKVRPLLFSVRPLDARSASGIAICRDFEAPPFTARESRLAHIVLSEVPWLHAEGWPEEQNLGRIPKLSRREQSVLNLLLEGHGRKQIAGHLNLSVHTIAQYQKEIYRHFGVQSHAGLMNRFFKGDGRDAA